MADGPITLLLQESQLGMSREEHSLRSQKAVEMGESQSPRLVGQIDEHIAAEYYVVRRLPGEKSGVDQVGALETDNPDNGFSEPPGLGGAAEESLLGFSQGLPEGAPAINGSVGGGQ